jgi:hypothetical protein
MTMAEAGDFKEAASGGGPTRSNNLQGMMGQREILGAAGRLISSLLRRFRSATAWPSVIPTVQRKRPLIQGTFFGSSRLKSCG